MPPSVAEPIERTCVARAAIAGNPSDGHGGAVVAVPVPSICAAVTVRPHTHWEFRPAAGVGGDAEPLVLAAAEVLERHAGESIAPLLIEVATTIPRSVGLAGSSAIVIATIRCIAAAHPDAGWAATIESEPDLLASIALAVERDEIGIPAGLQDRVVQAYDGPVFMDFGDAATRTVRGLDAGTYRRLPGVPSTTFVAARSATASSSASVHGDLAERRHDAPVRTAMRRLADQARQAADAIARGDATALGTAMDASFELRRSIIDLDPAHIEMVEIARSVGAHANYSGSGGAITVLATDEATANRARAALAAASCALFAT